MEHLRRRDKRFAHVVGGLELEHRKNDDLTSKHSMFDVEFQQEISAPVLKLQDIVVPRAADF